MFALPFSSIVTSSVKGVPSESWLPNFLPQLESGGCNQSSRASRNALLLMCWEGCGSIMDKDWTVCTCNGQVFRKQVDVMMLVIVHGPGHLRCTSKRDQLRVIQI